MKQTTGDNGRGNDGSGQNSNLAVAWTMTADVRRNWRYCLAPFGMENVLTLGYAMIGAHRVYVFYLSLHDLESITHAHLATRSVAPG